MDIGDFLFGGIAMAIIIGAATIGGLPECFVVSAVLA